MTAFSVGSFSSTGANSVRGQAFVPNVAGPNGSGSPGGASQANLKTVSIGYVSSSTPGRTMKIYVYSVALTDVDDIGQAANLVAESPTGAYVDGSGLFGTGTYYRKFSFNAAIFSVSAQYYIYFDRDQTPRIDSNNPYSGGNAYDTDLDDMSPNCLQFQVEMETV